jgi:hypothetical protein
MAGERISTPLSGVASSTGNLIDMSLLRVDNFQLNARLLPPATPNRIFRMPNPAASQMSDFRSDPRNQTVVNPLYRDMLCRVTCDFCTTSKKSK